MTVISGVSSITMPTAVIRSQGEGSSGFALPRSVCGSDVQPAVIRAGMAAAIGSSMLALQEQAGRDSADDEGRRHGHRVLDELARLQRALLSGGDAASLETLAALAQDEPRLVDPALGGVLASIRLRARIELERRTRRPDSRPGLD